MLDDASMGREVGRSTEKDNEKKCRAERKKKRNRNGANVVVAEGPPAFDLPIPM